MSLSRSCRLFGQSRQSIYKAEKRQRERCKELSQIKPLVLDIRREMPRIGTRKLYHLLKPKLEEKSIKLGRDGLFRYLRAEQMLVPKPKVYTKTTNSKHWLRKYPNLLTNREIKSPEEVFVSDITYIQTRDSTQYLSLVTDAYSRRIMGYKLSADMSTANVIQALQQAIRNKKTITKTIHHSDRGLQYCSKIYQMELKRNNMIPSMTDGYDCYQNALAERMNGIIKNEFLIYKCNTAEELQVLVDESIKTYNHKRPHTSLGYQTPNSYHENTRS